MAQTGVSQIAITPATGRKARVSAYPEHSTQTGLKGMAGYVSAGYISAVTGHITALRGFYRNAPQTGASDGAKSASLYLAEEGTQFKVTLRGTLSESTRGLRLNLSVGSDGKAWAVYNSDSSSAGILRCEGWESTWSAGDVNPEIIASVRAGSLQQNI